MASLAYLNTLLAYLSPTPSTTRRVYGRQPDPVNALAARIFRTWTIISGAVRTVAAYNMDDRNLYALALFTFLVADGHWLLEWLAYETAGWESMRASLAMDIGTPVVMAWGWASGWYF